MSALLKVSGVHKSFSRPDGGFFSVIDGIDFSLLRGEVVCLLGASGSGKTTLLRMLAGLDVPDAGTVSSSVIRPGPRLGYMIQGETLLPWRTALDNAALGLELLGERSLAARTAAAGILDKTGLGGFHDAFPAQLSGGMIQRVLLARLLATRPELVLMDEPMSNLDIPARRVMAGVIKSYVRESGAGALIVTHSIEEACFLADRILLITPAPALIYKEIASGITMDSVMAALNEALERGRS